MGESIGDYYKGDPMRRPDRVTDEAKKLVKPFLGPEKEPLADLTGEIKPMDYVLLTEGNVNLVGNHPYIVVAHQQKIPGRVTARQMCVLTDYQSDILSKYAKREMRSCYEYHVVFFANQERPFVFWEPFLQKVKVTDKRPISISIKQVGGKN